MVGEESESAAEERGGMKEKRVRFPSGQLSLEGVLGLPEEGSGPFPAVVLCHPHPLYGGSMDNNVIFAACEGLARVSIAWLRFNFRGVGMSGGRFDNGIGEQDDVKAALAYIGSLPEINPAKLGLCGYSFGTMVAIPVADSDDRVQAIAAVSPFFVSPGWLKAYRRPKLFICGDDDNFVNCRDVGRIVSELPERRRLDLVPGADHFWAGFESELATKLGDFFGSTFHTLDI